MLCPDRQHTSWILFEQVLNYEELTIEIRRVLPGTLARTSGGALEYAVLDEVTALIELELLYASHGWWMETNLHEVVLC